MVDVVSTANQTAKDPPPRCTSCSKVFRVIRGELQERRQGRFVTHQRVRSFQGHPVCLSCYNNHCRFSTQQQPNHQSPTAAPPIDETGEESHFSVTSEKDEQRQQDLRGFYASLDNMVSHLQNDYCQVCGVLSESMYDMPKKRVQPFLHALLAAYGPRIKIGSMERQKALG